MLGRIALRIATIGVLAFIYVPILVVVAYAFNSSGTTSWPPAGFTTRWVETALANTGLRDAFVTSIAIALGASAIALVLGSLAALAVARYRFFGREAISFVVVFPIALPGIVTGMALSTTFADDRAAARVPVDRHRARDVLHRARLQQRHRPAPAHRAIARGGLGRPGRRRLGNVPAGDVPGRPVGHAGRNAARVRALLRRGDRHDLHRRRRARRCRIWIFQSFRLANQVPLVNVAGLAAILLSVIPVYLASRLTADSGAVAGART